MPDDRWTNAGSTNATDFLTLDFGQQKSMKEVKIYVYDDGQTVRAPQSPGTRGSEGYQRRWSSAGARDDNAPAVSLRPIRVALIAYVLAGVARAEAAPADATVVVVDGDVRLRRADVAEARRSGQPLPPAGGSVVRAAQPGETIAFQVVVIAGATPLRATTLALAELAGPSGARLHTEVFREHYLRVDSRSRNERWPNESLGWQPGARPADATVMGDVPDALLPIAVDARPVAPPPAVPAGATGTFWIDVDVPSDAPPGRYSGSATLDGDGASLARFPIAIDVRPTPLPYRAAGVFIFYEAERLALRMPGGDAAAVERQLWQLLHAHHVDALAPLARASDVEHLASAYDGSWFSPAAGYHGPGTGRPPAIVALGAYGMLGAPSPDSLARVDQMVGRLPVGPQLFLYAIDESCSSPRAADWRQAFAAHPPPRPVAVAQTCSDPPARQPVDIPMVLAESFARGMPADARAAGRHAFIYNGMMPRTGTLMLDADPRGLVANGWIAAAMAIERWFYWESIFWSDDNRGGHGPIDPFRTAETFHNNEGDSALGDGLLLYPGRLGAPFAASSLGTDAVFPSLRLKAIRRGIEDAALIALAAREHPEETARVVTRALPAALDEADPAGPPSWLRAPLSFAEARDELRALVTGPAPLDESALPALFEDLATRRRDMVPVATAHHGDRPAGRRRPFALAVTVFVTLAALGFAVFAALRRARR